MCKLQGDLERRGTPAQTVHPLTVLGGQKPGVVDDLFGIANVFQVRWQLHALASWFGVTFTGSAAMVAIKQRQQIKTLHGCT